MDTIAVPPLRGRLTDRVARFADRREIGFETAVDPKFARAQRRYLGASGSMGRGDLHGSIPGDSLRRGLKIVTHNAREFVRVGWLGLEDWHGR